MSRFGRIHAASEAAWIVVKLLFWTRHILGVGTLLVVIEKALLFRSFQRAAVHFAIGEVVVLRCSSDLCSSSSLDVLVLQDCGRFVVIVDIC